MLPAGPRRHHGRPARAARSTRAGSWPTRRRSARRTPRTSTRRGPAGRRPSALPRLLRVAAGRRRCAGRSSATRSRRSASTPRTTSSIHRPPRAGDRLSTTRAGGRRASRRAPGTLVVTRLDDRRRRRRARSRTTDYGSVYRGVACERPERPPRAAEPSTASDAGRPPGGGRRRGAIGRSRCRVPAELAHVYTECARIWNPIHTDVAVARRAGLARHHPARHRHARARRLARGRRASSAAIRPRVARDRARASPAWCRLPSTLTVRGCDARARHRHRLRRASTPTGAPCSARGRRHRDEADEPPRRAHPGRDQPRAGRPGALRRLAPLPRPSTARRPASRSRRCASTSATAPTSSRSRPPAATRSRPGAASRATRSGPTATARARVARSDAPTTGSEIRAARSRRRRGLRPADRDDHPPAASTGASATRPRADAVLAAVARPQAVGRPAATPICASIPQPCSDALEAITETLIRFADARSPEGVSGHLLLDPGREPRLSTPRRSTRASASRTTGASSRRCGRRSLLTIIHCHGER